MNKTEDERQCSDQCYTSKAPWEGQAPSLARASWLLSTIDCLNYFGSFLGRGQGLLGSALGACFCLFLNAFSLKAESTWLSCIYQWGMIWARNVLLSSVCPETSQFRKEGEETSQPSPVHPFSCLPLPHTSRGICIDQWCRGWKVHGYMDHSIKKLVFLLFLLCSRMLSILQFHVAFMKKVTNF